MHIMIDTIECLRYVQSTQSNGRSILNIMFVNSSHGKYRLNTANVTVRLQPYCKLSDFKCASQIRQGTI